MDKITDAERWQFIESLQPVWMQQKQEDPLDPLDLRWFVKFGFHTTKKHATFRQAVDDGVTSQREALKK